MSRRGSLAVLVLIVVAVAYFAGQVARAAIAPPARSPHAMSRGERLTACVVRGYSVAECERAHDDP